MNISLKQIINILNHEGIGYREKQKYFNLFFDQRGKRLANKFNPHDINVYRKVATANERKNKALIKLIDRHLSEGVFYPRGYPEEYRLYVFFNDYNRRPTLDMDEPISTRDGEIYSYTHYHDCFGECNSCGEECDRDDMSYVQGDDLCNHCFDRYAYYCHDCDENFYSDDRCSCTDDRGLDGDDYQIGLQYLGVNSPMHKDKMFAETYGYETELEVRSGYDRYDIVEEIRALMNSDSERVACVRDGSLCSETGFEMVSTNATFEFHKNHFWNNFFKSDLPTKKLRAYKGSGTAIHIHFTRKAFTDHQLRHLNAFYHNPENKSFLVDVAGRECDQYASYVRGITYDDPIEDTARKYRAINFNNENTVEVRIFRSNIKQMSFFRCLELVHSINQFIKTVDIDRTDSVSYTEYFDFLLNNPKEEYVNLLVWLDDQEYFSHLKHITEFQSRYESFKNIVDDFKNNNADLIQQEREEN